ncbi:SH3 domain-containing protein [Psychromonas aquimarina]|uniref:SH3 domain-containing protein n=1 Tax=Psychromonas aquimarina TaxID=444919 RepID=UPI00041125BD|nr:SH3 domain-containing protein [Psychromonas aquimarina]
MKNLLIIVAVNLLFSAFSASAQQASTIIDTHLKTSPSVRSQSIEFLRTDTSVTILERRGGWYRVETFPQLQGWLKMLWLRYSVTGQRDDGFSLLTQGGGVTVATGIRGLSEEELEKGQGDPYAVNTLDRFTVSPEQARAFAEAGGLKQKHLPYADTE